MKKNLRKVTLASVFACALLAGSLGALNVNVASAVATEPEKFTMVDGASLRLENTDENIPFGMRFKTEVDPAWYDSLTNPQVYTVLLPTDMLGEAELTAETDDAVIVDIDERTIYTVFAGTDEEAYRFNAVLKNVPEDGYTREISVRSYITADNLDNPVYTPLATDSYSSVARSVAKVADLALTKDIDENTDKYSAVEKYLIKGIEANGTGLMIGGAGGNLGAKLAYNEGISDAVKAHLDAKYPLTYGQSTNEAAATIDENGKLTAGDTEGTANITVSCAALGLEKEVAVQAYVPTYGELINFNAIDWTTISKRDGDKAVDLKVVPNGDKQAISFELDGTAADQGNAGFYVYRNAFNSPEWFDSKRFDTATITVELNKEEGNTSGNWTLFGQYAGYAEANTHQLTNVGKGDETFTMTVGSGRFNDFYKSNCATIWVKQRNTYSATATFLVKNVTFGINDIANSTGNTVNLNEKFYVDGTNNSATYTFTSNGSTTGTPIDNPTAFAATEDGVITATISADGYKAGTLTAKYDYTKVVPYGQLVDFNDIDTTGMTYHLYGASNNNSVTIGKAVSPVSDKNALFASLNTTGLNQSSKSSIVFGIKIPKPDWANNFDTITYTVEVVIDDIDESEGGTTENVSTWTMRIPSNNTNNRTGNGKAKTLTYAVSTHLSADGSFVSIAGQISQASTDVIATIYITDITFGYSGLSYTEGGEALDLTAELGSTDFALTADDLSATFNGGAVDDVTAFTPTESGELVVTVKKSGYLPATFTVPVTYTAAS